MARINRFAKGSGAYRCSECGKLTRDTGAGEAGLELCLFCMEQMEWENYVADGGDPMDVPEEYRREGQDE